MLLVVLKSLDIVFVPVFALIVVAVVVVVVYWVLGSPYNNGMTSV